MNRINREGLGDLQVKKTVLTEDAYWGMYTLNVLLLGKYGKTNLRST